MSSTHIIRVLLAGNTREFVEAVASLLAMDPRVEIVGLAFSRKEALEVDAALRPDLVLVDTTAGHEWGLSIVRPLKEAAGNPRVIVTSLYDDPAYRTASYAAGADGFIGEASVGEMLLPLVAEILPEPHDLCST